MPDTPVPAAPDMPAPAAPDMPAPALPDTPVPAASDTAILLVAHGSERYPDAARPIHAHAAALRAGGWEVGVGLLNGKPPAAAALAGLTARQVVIVPFFMEAGWFTRSAVPRALGLDGATTRRDGGVYRYAAPVGTHPAMADVIEQRVRRIAGTVPNLLLIGHGSARAPGRVTALHDHAQRLRNERRFGRVEVAFLEEAPFAADMLAELPVEPLAVLGFFAGEGMHVRDDLPELIAAERATRPTPLVDCGTVAAEPGLRGIILDLAAATA